MKDKVIYRKDKSGEIVAIFPYLIASGSFVTCFTAKESHSSCDYWYMMRSTKPATKDEYEYIDRLLFWHYEYNLQPIKRYNHSVYLKAYYASKK